MKQHKPNPKLKKWEEFVPEYVSIINNFFQYGKDVPVLFVEGSEDKRFYDNIFPVKVIRKGYEFNVDKCPVFVGKFNTIDRKYIQQFGAPYFVKEESNNSRQKRIKKANKDIGENKVKAEKVDYISICKFVEEIGKKCFSEKYDHIKGFGFVDRDFKNKEIQDMEYKKNNLGYTLAHDYETSIFYLFFPSLCKEEYKNDDFVRKVSLILEFLIKQGVLEYCSNKSNYTFTHLNKYALKTITKDNFSPEKIKKENISKIIKAEDPTKLFFDVDFMCLYFNFDDYLLAQKDDKKKPFQNISSEKPYSLDSDQDKKAYSLFIRDYNSVIHKIYNCNLQQEVCKWLKGEENECILELLRWCNGHLLWKHLILNFGNMFNVTSDRELTDKFFHHIKENKAKLCKNPPLSLYLEFLEND